MKTLHAIIFALIVGNSQAQNYSKVPFYEDKLIIDSLKEELIAQRIDTIFCFLTSTNKVDLTYLIWISNSTTRLLRITDSEISKEYVVDFHFPNYFNLREFAMKENGKSLKLVPPIYHSQFCDVLICDFKDDEFILQLGTECASSEDTSDNSPKYCLFEFLKSEIDRSKIEWSKQSNYHRE